MNFFSQATEYISTLREKGFSDESFYTEYDFICYEVYKINHPESIQEVDSIQKQKQYEREILR